MRFDTLPIIAAFSIVPLLFAGCGESAIESSARDATESIQLPRVADERPVVVTFGDSLTAGYGVPAGSSYPDFLQTELDSRGLSYRVVNEGISGETTAQGLVRSEIVMSHRPKWVILAYGANDGLRGLSTERMEGNLRKMIQRFRDASVNVILAGMRLPPNYGSQYVGMFEAVFPALSADLDIPMIPFLLEGVAGDPKLNQADGIHPNVDGNRLVGAHVAEFFQQTVVGGLDATGQ